MLTGNDTLHGYLVVRRFNWRESYPLSRVLQRQPAVRLSTDEIAGRYRGFDGDAWPSDLFESIRKNEFGLVDPVYLNELLRIMDETTPRDRYDLIYVCSPNHKESSSVLEGGRLLGYEFGYFESVLNRYSVLLNEVIFGQYDEMRAFAGQLNGHLLLPSRAVARFLGAARENLENGGADLESNCACVSIAIVDPESARP
jgi:hypothetical protein